MMKYKKTLRVLTFILALFLIGKLCYKANGGFSQEKIEWDSPGDPRFAVAPLPEKEEKKILSCLDQPYYFLNHGGQSFVFVSQDGKTVIKFFKMDKVRAIPWLYNMPLPSLLDKARKKIVNFRENRLENTFTSCKIAYENMPKETAFLYYHINPTNHIKKSLTFYSKIGVRHTVDLDKTPFVLQKRVEMATDRLDALIKTNQIAAAEEQMESLLQLFVSRYEKGIHNNDVQIYRNFGFLENQAICLDLSCFSWKHELQDKTFAKKRFLREIQNLQHLIDNHYPRLSSFVRERITALGSEEL